MDKVNEHTCYINKYVYKFLPYRRILKSTSPREFLAAHL